MDHPYGVREYAATLVSVVDGDTAHLAVDMGFDCWQNLTVRFAGINAPEMSTTEGPVAKQYVTDHLAPRVVIRTIKDRREKYGRYLAWLFTPDGFCLNRLLVDNQLAVPYGNLPVDAPPVDPV